MNEAARNALLEEFMKKTYCSNGDTCPRTDIYKAKSLKAKITKSFLVEIGSTFPDFCNDDETLWISERYKYDEGEILNFHYDNIETKFKTGDVCQEDGDWKPVYNNGGVRMEYGFEYKIFKKGDIFPQFCNLEVGWYRINLQR